LFFLVGGAGLLRSVADRSARLRDWFLSSRPLCCKRKMAWRRRSPKSGSRAARSHSVGGWGGEAGERERSGGRLAGKGEVWEGPIAWQR
jgi:hypothetical protein